MEKNKFVIPKVLEFGLTIIYINLKKIKEVL